MEYKYTQNPTAQVPVMLIDKHIGRNAKGEEGIMGNQVAREVFALKQAGVKELDVWINSAGGNVFEGMSIYSVLKDSGLKVNTYNKGVADSVAGWVYQAGATTGGKRVWSNYAMGLMHNVQGATSEHADTVNTSIATMYSGSTKQSPEQVKELMQQDTLMTASKAKELGFCDELVNVSDITELTNSSDVDEVRDFGAKEIAKTLPKNKDMSAINTLLGLQNEASEDSRIAAIQALMNAKNTAETTVATLTNSNTTLTETLRTTTESLATASAKLTEMENSAKRTKAETLVNEHKGKRIADKPEVIEKWINQAISDYDGTKTLIESLNWNEIAPKPDTFKPNPDIILSAAQYTAA